MWDQEYLNIGNFDELPVEEHGVLHMDCLAAATEALVLSFFLPYL
jgi:hypothetical protein